MSWWWWLLPALLLLLAGSTHSPASDAAKAPPQDAECARCHRAIYESYRQTPMARASGPAIDGLMHGDFMHAASGVHYRIFDRSGQGWMSYARPETAAGGRLQGEVALAYFIGSNTRGRTYLFERDGFWFEAPINWYAKKGVWDMAPNYLTATEMPLTLPVDPNCLHCHATGVARSTGDARNHFSGQPFAHGGIGCASCHGDAAEHVRTGGRAAVLNPAKLDAVRRDSVCLQCHLEGETAIYRQGHSLAAFAPGQSLFDSVSYFIHRSDVAGDEGRATSQYEGLLESACKRASGDALTCTTCHDPHATETTATTAQRVAFYRGKCLSCHAGARFAVEHHPEQPDCARCHMPRGKSEDIAHEQVTDHRIQLPDAGRKVHAGEESREMAPIGASNASPRELGLAYAQMAHRGDRASGEKALELLRKAEASGPSHAADADLHTELGFLEQMAGNIPAADREYRAALTADPGDGTARGDLAVLFAHTGDYETAVRLWERVFAGNPAELAAGYDLALGQCRVGEKAEAQATLTRLLTFAPDKQLARALAAAIASGQQRCGR